jgi:hypothetical protein
VAYFYRFGVPANQQKEAINATDLKEAARLAQRKQPANASTTLHNAKNAGYLDATGRGMFQINSVGENLVTMTLPGSGETPTPGPGRKARMAGKKQNRKKGTKKLRPGGKK